jgi:glutathione S-transferase
MKLFFAPRTRSVRPRWVLEELEVPYELVRIDPVAGEHRNPAFLAMSPLGEVPVLIDGDVTLTEAAAICLHLADRFPEKRLAPAPSSPERASYYQWLLFAELRLEPLMLEFLRNAQAPAPADLTPQRAQLDRLLRFVDTALGDRELLVGDTFNVADLVMVSILHIGTNLNLVVGYPRLTDYVMRHAMRPAIRRALS